MHLRTVALLAALVLVSGCVGQGGTDAEFTGTLPQQAVIGYMDQTGHSLEMTGYPGYVYIFANTSTANDIIKEAIEVNGGEIVDSLSDAGIYTVKVDTGKEGTFLSAMYGQSWFVDGSPAFEFDISDMFMYDFFSHAANPSSCKDDHGDLGRLKAESLGGTVNSIDVRSVTGTQTVGMAKSIIQKAEDAESRGVPAVFSFSLQSHESKITHITDDARAGGCLVPNCTIVRNAQRAFLRTFFQTMDAEIRANPRVADNMMLVIASGNAGADLDNQLRSLKQRYPEAYKRIKIVGGSFENGAIIQQYNYMKDNSGIDMAYARGTNVQIYNPDTGTTTLCHGTSFAAPEVAAVLNEIWTRNPTLTSDQVIDAFNRALAELGTNGVMPQDQYGETTTAFIDRASALAGNPNGGGGVTPPAGSITFTGPSLLTATKGGVFSYSLCKPDVAGPGATCGGLVQATNPTGGSPPYSISISSGGGFLPPGITLNLNGLLKGTPTTKGNYPFRVCARDGAGLEGCTNVVINVEEAVPVQPTETTYSGQFSGSGQYGRPWPEYGTTCVFDDSFSGTMDLDMTEAAGGSVSGTATITGTFTSNTVSGSVPGFDCLSSSVSMDGSATVSGTTSNIIFTHHFYTAGGSDYAGAFTGSLSGSTITGTFTETSTCCSGSVSIPVTLAA
ncbi:MAG: S8 family serine peptidase [Candidatus Aenigmatarchaeota archaeon]